MVRVLCELEEAGVTLLQYRNKQNEAHVPHDAKVMKIGATSALRLIMNDYPDLAVSAGFDGVHVGQTDISATEVRKIVGPEKIVGVSTHNRAQLQAADRLPVDYIAFGPVFATASKLNPDPIVGLDGVREARSLTSKPLVAIGGITLENARAVRDAGADSVAVISAMFGPDKDPAKIARDFLHIFR